jgi:hypothetical protein
MFGPEAELNKVDVLEKRRKELLDVLIATLIAVLFVLDVGTFLWYVAIVTIVTGTMWRLKKELAG